MPFSKIQKLGKSKQDLIEINMQITTFTWDPTMTMGVLIVEITVGPKMSTTAFFW